MKTKFLAIVSILLSISSSAAAPVRADRMQPVPETQMDERTKLTLAQALVGEADWHAPDHVAISWVLAKRWQWIEEKSPGKMTFEEYVRAYASPLKVKNARTEWIQALPWETLPPEGKLGPFVKHWDRVRELVEHWADGNIPDPCPQAVHWGGEMDRPGKAMKPVNCGKTLNIFYSQRRW